MGAKKEAEWGGGENDPGLGLRADGGGGEEGDSEGGRERWRYGGMGGGGRSDGWASLGGRLIGRGKALTCSV